MPPLFVLLRLFDRLLEDPDEDELDRDLDELDELELDFERARALGDAERTRPTFLFASSILVG